MSRGSSSRTESGSSNTAAIPRHAVGASPAPTPSLASFARPFARWLTILRLNWPLTAVLSAYGLAMLIIPTLAPVGISDDWTYARSVEYLVWDGRFHILPVSAATQIFQLFWGALFASIFGMTFGALRLSTIAIVFLSGLALYGICRQLNVSRSRSALGAAAYLFNPVLFPITYTFMSDPHFLALVVIASYFYLKGLLAWPKGERDTVIAAVISAVACLQRPHGALIPLGVVTYLLISRSFGWNRASLDRFVQIVAIPAATFVGYYFIIARGLSTQQSLFFSYITDAGWGQSWLLIRRLTVFELVYIGLFVLPIVLGSLGQIVGFFTLQSAKAWLWIGAWTAVVAIGVGWMWGEKRYMPYIPHFLGRGGPGSGDLRAARPPLARTEVFQGLTIVCAVAAFIFAVSLVQRLDRKPSPGHAGAGMLLAVGVWQGIGALPQSFLFRNFTISLDRYVMPLLPFAVALLLWSLNDRPFLSVVAWPAMAAVALFSVLGTRDVLVFQNDVWTLAGQLNAHGVDNTRLDAGYAWDAYHLWEYSEEYHIPRQTIGGPWWLDYATADDSTYLIAGGPVRGYDVISVQPYSAWLQQRPMFLFVLRRHGTPPDGVDWPPGSLSKHAAKRTGQLAGLTSQPPTSSIKLASTPPQPARRAD